jgi:hypothetical protein
MRKILEADDNETLFYRAGKSILRAGSLERWTPLYMDTNEKGATASAP